MYDAPVRSVTQEWKTKEFIVPPNCHVFVAYANEMTSEADAKIVYVPFEVQDIETYVMDQLIEFESREPNFREYVEDKGINMSFNEMFYCDDKGWIFNCEPPLRLRNDLDFRLLFEDMDEGQFIDQLWETNVAKFFDDKYYYKQFYEYITTDQEADFNSSFYFYVAKKLMEQGEWVTYDDIREVEY
jgi:hypothetical protein